ncbi:MAG: hypothetical protein KGK08_14600 [Acidobacteriota bacterium]|nr:hypothetical protein [Acidobacteriota bacterium]
MTAELLKFMSEHPQAVLTMGCLVAVLWLFSSATSIMPPLPKDAGWWMTWAYGVAQLVGGNINRVFHVVEQQAGAALEKKAEAAALAAVNETKE